MVMTIIAFAVTMIALAMRMIAFGMMMIVMGINCYKSKEIILINT